MVNYDPYDMPMSLNSFVIILNECKVKDKFSGIITTYCIKISIQHAAASSRPIFAHILSC